MGDIAVTFGGNKTAPGRATRSTLWLQQSCPWHGGEAFHIGITDERTLWQWSAGQDCLLKGAVQKLQEWRWWLIGVSAGVSGAISVGAWLFEQLHKW